ncbi:MAG: hypothetical protein RL203_902, partial [Pseudomonadota bacterium]
FEGFGAFLLRFRKCAKASEPNLLRLFFHVVCHVGRVKRVFGGHGETFKVGVAEVPVELKFLRRLQALAVSRPL